MFTKPMTPEDTQRIKELNEAVNEAIRLRTEWLDSKMAEYSEAQVGDPVFDEYGVQIGTVTELYRYHTDKDVRYDRSLSIELQIRSRIGYLDNTSRQPFKVFTKDQVKKRLQNQLDAFLKR